MSVLDAVLYGTTSGALAVVFSALNTIAPRVLLRCVRTCVYVRVCVNMGVSVRMGVSM
jgi:hypothetical protein